MSAANTDRFRMAAAEQNLPFQNVAYMPEERKVNLTKTGTASVTLTIPGVALYFGWWNQRRMY